jgi:hypothetical protein
MAVLVGLGAADARDRLTLERALRHGVTAEQEASLVAGMPGSSILHSFA